MRLDAHTSHPQLQTLRAAVRPLLLDTGVPEAPVSTWGTCFLCAHGTQMFVVTAAHLVLGVHSGQVRVLPTNGSAKRLILSQGLGRPNDDPADDVDVVVLPAESVSMKRQQLRRMRLVNLNAPEALRWQKSAPAAQFVVIGYPREINSVDYEQGRVMASQVWICGTYAGPRYGSQTVHTIRVDNPLGLVAFAGLSGSPVFSVEHRVGSAPVFRFCGVAIVGTTTAGTMDFAEAESVVSLLHDAIHHVRRFGLRPAALVQSPPTR